MSYRRVPFVEKEWFHCYTRGVEGRTTFETAGDYSRFMQSLYLCNSSESIRRDDIKRITPLDLYTHLRRESLVDIGAYCLMPNHFHLLLRSRLEGGITRFMQKVGTAYTMYFNIKNKRVGSLFITPFRSKHIPEDVYFKRVAQYIHLNPVELFEPDWKKGLDFVTARRRLAVTEKRLRDYPYSSLVEYEKIKGLSKRPERAILDAEAFDFIKEGLPPLTSMLENAALYYQELSP